MKLEEINDQQGLDKLIENSVQEAVSGLLAKNSELIGKLKTAKDNVPENLADLLTASDELEKLRSTKLEEQGDYKKLLEQSKLQHSEAMGQLQSKLKAEQSQVKGLLVTGGLHKALAAANVNPDLLEAAISILQHDVSIVGNNGTSIAMVGDKDLSQYVKDWAGENVGKHFILAPNNAGGNANGNGTKNPINDAETPFRKDTWNLTEQAQLSKADPEAYKGLVAKYPTQNTGANASQSD